MCFRNLAKWVHTPWGFPELPKQSTHTLISRNLYSTSQGTENYCNFFQQIPEWKLASHFKKNPIMENVTYIKIEKSKPSPPCTCDLLVVSILQSHSVHPNAVAPEAQGTYKVRVHSIY